MSRATNDGLAKILSEFMIWYDEPKTTLLHNEGFRYYHAQIHQWCKNTLLKARIKDLEELLATKIYGAMQNENETDWVLAEEIEDRIAELRAKIQGEK